MSLLQIYEGWKNKLIPSKLLKEQIKTVSDERMEICDRCPFHSENRKLRDKKFSTIRPDVHCTSCGCTLSAKTACLSCSCPKNFWMPVLSEEQENNINEDNEE
jgi:hypothetical protein